MVDWIIFGVSNAFIAVGMFIACSAVLGLYRFNFVVNRMHAAAMIDSFALLLAMIGVAVAYGFSFATVKVVLIVLLIWVASPVSGHLIARLEVTTDKHLSEECEVRE